jgi:hypothetical protein
VEVDGESTSRGRLAAKRGRRLQRSAAVADREGVQKVSAVVKDRKGTVVVRG